MANWMSSILIISMVTCSMNLLSAFLLFCFTVFQLKKTTLIVPLSYLFMCSNVITKRTLSFTVQFPTGWATQRPVQKLQQLLGSNSTCWKYVFKIGDHASKCTTFFYTFFLLEKLLRHKISHHLYDTQIYPSV